MNAPRNYRTCPSPVLYDADGRGYAPWTMEECTADWETDASPESGLLLFHVKWYRNPVLQVGDVVVLKVDTTSIETVEREVREYVRSLVTAKDGTVDEAHYDRVLAETIPYLVLKKPIQKVTFVVNAVYVVPRFAAREFGEVGVFEDGVPFAATLGSDAVGIVSMQMENANWATVSYVTRGEVANSQVFADIVRAVKPV